MKVTPKKVREFQSMIFDWWKLHRRDLPWRHTRNPYKILVSEVMLQQTQVSRVLPKYQEFLAAFPNVESLSRANAGYIIRLWKGLGYNRRALYLKKTAETVVAQYNGIFPHIESELVKLPGLGTYTARALMVFAFEKDVAMVDTNIRQIITHFFLNGLPVKEKVIQEIADALIPVGKSWHWHQALMDFGALELSKHKPTCIARRKAQPFTTTNRYFRGRIIDLLRENNIVEKECIATLIVSYGKSEKFFTSLISKLILDGLVVRDGTMLRLPQ